MEEEDLAREVSEGGSCYCYHCLNRLAVSRARLEGSSGVTPLMSARLRIARPRAVLLPHLSFPQFEEAIATIRNRQLFPMPR